MHCCKNEEPDYLPYADAVFSFQGSNPSVPYAVCAGNFTVFTDLTPASDSAVSRAWTIDGVISPTILQTFQYRIPNAGSNQVTLQVTTNKGCVGSKTQEVDVFPALTADFSFTGVCFGQTSEFRDATHSLSIGNMGLGYGRWYYFVAAKS